MEDKKDGYFYTSTGNSSFLWSEKITFDELNNFVPTTFRKNKNPYVPKEIHVDASKKVMVVKWDDGTETKVTCDPQDNFSVDVGFGMALTEHVFGSKREFKEKWWKIIQRRIKYH
jgi:hypothetical protein